MNRGPISGHRPHEGEREVAIRRERLGKQACRATGANINFLRTIYTQSEKIAMRKNNKHNELLERFV